MKAIKRLATVMGSALALAVATQPAGAVLYTGNLTQPSDVLTFNFTVGIPSQVTLHTLSYAGGVAADSTVIGRGGFDPFLSVYDCSNALSAFNDDGGAPFVPEDSGAGGTFKAWDSYLNLTLTPGDYFVALSVYPGFPLTNNFAGGFFPATSFTDTSGFDCCNQRTSAYALEILQAPVPEPATWAMMIVGFGFVGGSIRYRRATRVRAAIA